MNESQASIAVVTIDGPSGSGKGTVSALVAQRLGWNLLDSGALYRLTAVAAQKHGIALNDEAALSQLAATLDVQFLPAERGVNVVLEGETLGGEFRTEEVGAMASKVAALQGVRNGLFQRQRNFAVSPGLVADGRDMGTVVFTDAPLKIYLTASAEERAKRRFEQLRRKGIDASVSRLLADIEARDKQDSERTVAPLKPADDAIVIDSTAMSIEAVLEAVLDNVALRQLV